VLGIAVGQAKLRRFPDTEVSFQIEENIRGTDVFVVQPTSPPVDQHIMELLVMIDAFRRSSAARITAVIPYYGYARQDRKDKPRVPISAKLVANILGAAGANRVLTMDLHQGADPGVLRHPGGPPVRGAGDHRPPGAAAVQERHHRLAGRRRGGAGARVRQAPGRGAGHHRQAPLGRGRPPEVMNVIGEVRGAPASSRTTSSTPAARCRTRRRR